MLFKNNSICCKENPQNFELPNFLKSTGIHLPTHYTQIQGISSTIFLKQINKEGV